MDLALDFQVCLIWTGFEPCDWGIASDTHADNKHCFRAEVKIFLHVVNSVLSNWFLLTNTASEDRVKIFSHVVNSFLYTFYILSDD
jgi:hypothetical protein